MILHRSYVAAGSPTKICLARTCLWLVIGLFVLALRELRRRIVVAIPSLAFLLAMSCVLYAQTTTVPGTSVSTTGPVTSQTTIETGTFAGEFLIWVASAFGVSLGSLASAILYRVFRNIGITMTDKMRARLQQIVVNGLNAAAGAAAENLAGKGAIEIKQPIVASAVKYVQDHGKDELRALGVDPTSEEAVAAIRARIETAIVDPAAPTPAVITPPGNR